VAVTAEVAVMVNEPDWVVTLLALPVPAVELQTYWSLPDVLAIGVEYE